MNELFDNVTKKRQVILNNRLIFALQSIKYLEYSGNFVRIDFKDFCPMQYLEFQIILEVK